MAVFKNAIINSVLRVLGKVYAKNIEAETVEISGTIIVEGVDLKKSVSDGKKAVADAITDLGVTTSPSATFDEIAKNIGKIIGHFKTVKPITISNKWSGLTQTITAESETAKTQTYDQTFTHEISGSGSWSGVNYSWSSTSTLKVGTTLLNTISKSGSTDVGGTAPASAVLSDYKFSSVPAGRDVQGTMRTIPNFCVTALSATSFRTNYTASKNPSAPNDATNTSFTTGTTQNYVSIKTVTGYHSSNSNELLIPASSFGAAVTSDVLSGKTFTSNSGVSISGTIRTVPNFCYTELSSVSFRSNYNAAQKLTYPNNATNTSFTTVSSQNYVSINSVAGYHSYSSNELLIPASSFGSATAGAVVSGSTFTSNSGVKLTGTLRVLPDRCLTSVREFGSSLNNVKSPSKPNESSDTTYTTATTANYILINTVAGFSPTNTNTLAILASSFGNAAASDVLSDKTFTSNNGLKVSGTIRLISRFFTTSELYSTDIMKNFAAAKYYNNDPTYDYYSVVNDNYIGIKSVAGYHTTDSNLLIPASLFGEATTAEVLSGKTFTSTAGIKTSGQIRTVPDYCRTEFYGTGYRPSRDAKVPSNPDSATDTLFITSNDNPKKNYVSIKSVAGYHTGTSKELLVEADKFGKAETSDVLSGKTFTSDNGVNISGTIPHALKTLIEENTYPYYMQAQNSSTWSTIGYSLDASYIFYDPQARVLERGTNKNVTSTVLVLAIPNNLYYGKYNDQNIFISLDLSKQAFYIGDAAATDVLRGKKFTSSNGLYISGTMPEISNIYIWGYMNSTLFSTTSKAISSSTGVYGLTTSSLSVQYCVSSNPTVLNGDVSLSYSSKYLIDVNQSTSLNNGSHPYKYAVRFTGLGKTYYKGKSYTITFKVTSTSVTTSTTYPAKFVVGLCTSSATLVSPSSATGDFSTWTVKSSKYTGSGTSDRIIQLNYTPTSDIYLNPAVLLMSIQTLRITCISVIEWDV